MRRAGVATAVAQGVTILESEGANPPGLGKNVVDDSLETVGTVVDVIGPVAHPYIVVSPAGDRNPAALLGETLYLR